MLGKDDVIDITGEESNMCIGAVLQAIVAGVRVIDKYSDIEELKRKEKRELDEYWKKSPEQRSVSDLKAICRFFNG
jgi:hypothetical protein